MSVPRLDPGRSSVPLPEPTLLDGLDAAALVEVADADIGDARQGHPEIADEERRENLGAVPDVRADLLRLGDHVRELRDAYWRARECGAA